MGIGFGFGAWMGYAVEDTWGVAKAATNWNEIVEEEIRLKQTFIPKPSLRRVGQKNGVKSKKSIEGGVKVQATFKGIENLLLAALGEESARSVIVSGAYRHTFTLADSLPSLTVEINRDSSNMDGDSFVYSGCQVQKFTLSQAVEDFLMLQVDFLGKDEAFDSVSTPTYPTFKGIDWEMASTVKVNNVSIDAKMTEFTIENGLAEDRYKLGARTRVGIGRGDYRKVSGKLELELNGKTQYELFQNLTGVPIQVIWTSGEMITGSTPYRMELNIPNAKFDGNTPVVGNPGVIPLELPFVALLDTNDADELNIVLDNDTNGF